MDFLLMTSRYRYSLKSKNCVKQNSHWVQNSIFPDEIFFSQFIFIDEYLKFREIEYLIHYVKCEMRPVLSYLNFLSYLYNTATQIGT